MSTNSTSFRSNSYRADVQVVLSRTSNATPGAVTGFFAGDTPPAGTVDLGPGDGLRLFLASAVGAPAAYNLMVSVLVPKLDAFGKILGFFEHLLFHATMNTTGGLAVNAAGAALFPADLVAGDLLTATPTFVAGSRADANTTGRHAVGAVAAVGASNNAYIEISGVEAKRVRVQSWGAGGAHAVLGYRVQGDAQRDN
ncbi:hypothetical protein [Tolypothrix sp. VBCCA 56010]|uniref:hypothetical protein n=1 Tax=Tolypothrix sp. VBCCA 56010 TaxID=3137731 RepID=UPI003D7E8346